MAYRIFSQTPPGELDLSAIESAARRHSPVEVTAIRSAPDCGELHARRGENELTATISVRTRTPEDLVLARSAERRGRSAGMADLAERCPAMWIVDSPEGSDESLLLELCAVLASVALGPVLPPSEDSLFGIRGARERARKLGA